MRKECIFTLKNSYRDDLNIIRGDDLTSVKTDMPGIFSRHVEPGEEVYRGEVLASITDPMEGEVVRSWHRPMVSYFLHTIRRW